MRHKQFQLRETSHKHTYFVFLFIDQDGKNQNVQFTILPGLEAVVPQITAGDLKTPYMKLFDDMPHMTLQSAFWHTTPVTVKRFKGREDSRQLLMREADLLR